MPFRFRSLERRPRGRPLVELRRRLELPSHLAPLAAAWGQREVAPPRLRPGAVTRHFHRLLDGWEPRPEELDEESRSRWEDADDDERVQLRVHLAVWQDAPGFTARSGLSAAEPPPELHAMARGPLAAGGSLQAADLVADGLELVGRSLWELKSALDFGCSSGRVVRALAAAAPDVAWHGCDPNGAAVTWAGEHLPAISFTVSPEHPPLAFDDGAFDLVLAISVWSHLSDTEALRWFDEMHRVIRRGGVLVLTVQGWHALAELQRGALWQSHDISAAMADLAVRGHHFRSTFGPDGDHGTTSAHWGWALMSPEWLAMNVTPRWAIRLLRPGAHEGVQDLVVLERC